MKHRVICIRTSENLTIGKAYDFTHYISKFIYVTNDKNITMAYGVECFKLEGTFICVKNDNGGGKIVDLTIGKEYTLQPDSNNYVRTIDDKLCSGLYSISFFDNQYYARILKLQEILK